jgi:hypothetical protein
MLANNAKLAGLFNLTPEFVKNEIQRRNLSNLPSEDQIKNVLDRKTLAVNVFYEELIYTKIEEEAKIEV